MKILKKIHRFINSEKFPHVQWLEDETMKVYVRRANRYIEKKRVSSLDIATVNVNEELQGQGIWTKFIREVEKINIMDVLYVENVQMDRFKAWFRRNGWKEISSGDDDWPSSFYKWREIK